MCLEITSVSNRVKMEEFFPERVEVGQQRKGEERREESLIREERNKMGSCCAHHFTIKVRKVPAVISTERRERRVVRYCRSLWVNKATLQLLK